MGSNLAGPAGSPEATISAAAARLQSLGSLLCRSSLYSTAPVGFANQPRFLNAVVALETERTPRALLDSLLGIEETFGRDRSAGIPNGPRTLDLDILLLGNLTVSEPGLEIPHPRLAQRAFVLVPLNEIAPDLCIPGLTRTVAELFEAFLKSCENEANAVFPIESEIWSMGARHDAGSPSEPLRPAARIPDPDSRR
jgi:2-amino-4-hydroxy-6-hydroxymethyldihydropteridine diphosphokinase